MKSMLYGGGDDEGDGGQRGTGSQTGEESGGWRGRWNGKERAGELKGWRPSERPHRESERARGQREAAQLVIWLGPCWEGIGSSGPLLNSVKERLAEGQCCDYSEAMRRRWHGFRGRIGVEDVYRA